MKTKLTKKIKSKIRIPEESHTLNLARSLNPLPDLNLHLTLSLLPVLISVGPNQNAI